METFKLYVPTALHTHKCLGHFGCKQYSRGHAYRKSSTLSQQQSPNLSLALIFIRTPPPPPPPTPANSRKKTISVASLTRPPPLRNPVRHIPKALPLPELHERHPHHLDLSDQQEQPPPSTQAEFIQEHGKPQLSYNLGDLQGNSWSDYNSLASQTPLGNTGLSTFADPQESNPNSPPELLEEDNDGRELSNAQSDPPLPVPMRPPIPPELCQILTIPERNCLPYGKRG